MKLKHGWRRVRWSTILEAEMNGGFEWWNDPVHKLPVIRTRAGTLFDFRMPGFIRRRYALPGMDV